MELQETLAACLTDPHRVTVSESVRDLHSADLSYHQPHRPDIVVFPETTAEVAKVLECANDLRIPVTAFAAGTSLEGHTIPVEGGISLDLTRMNRIIDVRPRDFMVRVQPGVTRHQLNDALRSHGLFFPVDPGADATLGGMAATNASGTTAVRYGVMRDQVLALEVVLSDGRVIHTGSEARKSSAGYHLTGLFCGSEGTLGIITELTLKLQAVPEHTVAARAQFATVKDACEAACALVGSGLQVGRVELVDEKTITAVNKYSNTAYEETPTLFLDFSGTEAMVSDSLQTAEALCRESGATQFQGERDFTKRQQLWEARHHAALAIMQTAPGKRHMATDVCVPLSQMPDAIVHARQTIDAYGIYGAILGHVGDGNYHVSFMVDANNAEEVRTAEEVNEAIVCFAFDRGGTCTGEHGVGIGKRKYLAVEHADTIGIMRTLKQMFDPNGILNPGKLFLGD
jgi:D-lactate dehydrogenase (cytochrome)